MSAILGHTTNFVIRYDKSLTDGLRRAKALKKSCESDFAKLRKWFTATGGFGPKNRVTLTVVKASGGSNGKYQTGGNSWVKMCGFDKSPNKKLADDATRAVFIAEIVEILMSYENLKTKKTSWHPGWSDGEGLSRVSLELFYPDAAYQLLGAPYVNGWMQSAKRPDYVSKIKHSDTDGTSFGCAILFIYYLYSQLGYGMNSIVSKAGSTLEDTYKALTGKSGGYKTFTKLLAKYFPVGAAPTLPFDDPFPLTDGSARSVRVFLSESAAAPPAGSTSGTATFNACSGSPVSKYKWTLTDRNEQLTCVARVSGFARPVYNWKINGKSVSGEGSGYIGINATVVVDDPNNPESPTSSTQSVTLYFSGYNSEDYHGLSSTMLLYNESYPGHILLTIEADVSETDVSKDVTSGLALGTLDAQTLKYEKKYYKDLADCRAGWLREFGPVVVLAPWVTLLLTLPDPAPELLNGAAVLSAIAAEVAAISATQPELGQQVAMTISGILNVSVAMLLPSASQAGG